MTWVGLNMFEWHAGPIPFPVFCAGLCQMRNSHEIHLLMTAVSNAHGKAKSNSRNTCLV